MNTREQALVDARTTCGGRVLYDAHCHLQDARLAPLLPGVAESLRHIRLGKAVVNGTREADWDAVLQLASSYEFVVPSLGLHPWYIQERSEGWRTRLERALESGRVAIGEIGLDRWMHGYDSADQERVFLEQLALAAARGLPISIHCLKAWGRLLELLQSGPRSAFLLHSYGGPAEMISSFAGLGAYFSISGYFAHARKARQREVFRRVPLDRLLIETDSPDMALPADKVEFRLDDPALNHPANLRAVYGFVAELRGLPAEELAAQVEGNFKRLFAPVLAVA